MDNDNIALTLTDLGALVREYCDDLVEDCLLTIAGQLRNVIKAVEAEGTRQR